jgi:hypothetical protein
MLLSYANSAAENPIIGLEARHPHLHVVACAPP